MNLRNNSLKLTIAGVSAVALMMGACSPKNKGGAALKSADIEVLELDRADAKVFAPYFDVPERKVSEANSLAALKALGLDESKGDALSWGGREGANGTYVFTDLSAKGEDDSTLKASKATFYGLREMAGEDGKTQAIFDRVDLEAVEVASEDLTIKADAISLSEPSPVMARAFVEALRQPSGAENLDLDNGEMSFGAVALNGITISGEELAGTVEQIMWGNDDETDRADASIGKIKLALNPGTDEAGDLTFDGMSLRNFNTSPYDPSALEGGTFSALLAQFDSFDIPYDSFTIGEGAFNMEGLSISFEGGAGEAVTKGDVTTVTQQMKPFNINFGASDSADPQWMGMIKELGFEEMSFSGSSRTILDRGKDEMRVEDGLFVMKDGFRMNMEYVATGLDAMRQRAKGQAAAEKAQSERLQKALMEAYATEGSDDDREAAQAISDYNTELMQSSLADVKLAKMRMTLEDNSIVERGMGLASKVTGQSEKQIKRSLGMAVLAAPMMGRNDLESDLLAEAAGAFVAFVKEGGTLTIQMDPPAPFPVTQLMGENAANVNADALGFTARHDAPKP